MPADYTQMTVDVLEDDQVIVTRQSVSALGTISRDRRLRETIDVLHRQLLANRLTEREEFELLGSCLFDFLFTDVVRSRVRSWLEDTAEGILRVVLQFDADSDLGWYPWEYLHVPGEVSPRRKGFVATRQELVLSRHVRLTDDDRPAALTPVRERLRIFVGIASPQREEIPSRDGGGGVVVPLADLLEETHELVDALERSGAEVRVDRALTKSGLAAALAPGAAGFRPHVVHLVAHGRYIRGEGGALALCREDRPGMAAWVRDQDLGDCLGHSPTVVFLHACSGARTEQFQGFRGVAMRLVERDVPAVVAMNFDIEAGIARDFALAFYEALAQGRPIDHAVQLGRNRIGTGGQAANFQGRAFGCPVAFVQVPGAVFLPTDDQGAPAPAAAAVPEPARLVCPCGGTVQQGMRMCVSCKTRIAVCPNPACGRIWRPADGVCPWCEYTPEPAGTAPHAMSTTPAAATPGHG